MVWNVDCAINGSFQPIGQIELPFKPSAVSKRLSAVAFSIGGASPGNLVYANTAADAETIAQQVYDALTEAQDIEDKRRFRI